MGLLHDSRMGLHVRLAQLWMDRCLDVVWFFQYPRIVVVAVVVLPRIVVVVVVIVVVVVVVDFATLCVVDASLKLPCRKPHLAPLTMLLLVIVVVNSKLRTVVELAPL